MQTVTGIFDSYPEAAQAMAALQEAGIDMSRISFLAPAEHPRAETGSHSSEMSGTGTAVGALVGGTTGAAVAAIVLVPGIGPIVSAGIIAAALLGGGLGAAAGGALEHSLAGDIPRSEVYFYERALRSGRSVVLVRSDYDSGSIAELLHRSGAHTIEGARREWWSGLREAEAEYCRHHQRDFDSSEYAYRNGFEAAFDPNVRGRSYEEALPYLESCYSMTCQSDAFRIGFDRGGEHWRGTLPVNREVM